VVTLQDFLDIVVVN